MQNPNPNGSKQEQAGDVKRANTADILNVLNQKAKELAKRLATVEKNASGDLNEQAEITRLRQDYNTFLKMMDSCNQEQAEKQLENLSLDSQNNNNYRRP